MERTNKIYIVGILKEILDERTGEKDGVKWIAGTAVVLSGNNEIEAKFYSQEKTKDGKENKRYANYLTLKDRVGERISLNGNISGRLWFNTAQGQVINFNEVSAGFFNTPKSDAEDTATFEIGGFVVKGLHERYNQKEELIAYEMEIAQANYQGTNMEVIRLSVDADNPNVGKIGMTYPKDATIYVSGEIRYEVTVEERIEEVAFGDPIVKRFNNLRKSFVITAGKQPITDEGVAYSRVQIATLQDAYSNYMAQLEKEAKTKNEAGETVVKKAPAASNNQDRLL